jgi:hypothetical protein
MVLSAGVTSYLLIDNDTTRSLAFGEWLAPLNINIELNKEHAYTLSVLSEPMGRCYYFSPTTQTGMAMENIVMHTELRNTGFHRRIFLRMRETVAEEVINAIDNISVFVGNKFYYFSKEDMQKSNKKTKDGYALFRISGPHYEKSLVIKDWINYYGDFNIGLKIFCGFLFYPGRFIPSYLFLAGLLFLYRKQIVSLYRKSRQKRKVQAVVLVIISVFAFALRINGYVRHSGWADEIYSAAWASNPNFPFLATFSDHGNPPFYFILLRYWFKLFGWSEEAGTMLSVVLGTFAIPTLYIFVKRNFGGGTALLAAFFMAASGFAVGYSHEMRAYILLIFLLPLAAQLFLDFLHRKSLKNMMLYIFPSLFLANTHYYGILFIMANFIFFCLYEGFTKTFKLKKILAFFAGNILIALSFLPFFLYQILVEHYNFQRDFTVLRIDYVLILIVIIIFTALAVIYRKKIVLDRLCTNQQPRRKRSGYVVLERWLHSGFNTFFNRPKG